MLHIYTRTNIFWKKEYLRYVLSRITKRSRGPGAVIESVIRGLDILNIPYSINAPYTSIKPGDTVYVISGTQAVRDILDVKKRLKNIKLLVGPTITVLPSDENNLIKDSAIDAIIVPSQWVKDLYISTDATLAPRIQIVPAGVPEEIGNNQTNKKKILIYFKNAPENLYTHTCQILSKHNIEHITLRYGTFKRDEYFKALTESFAMIYLSPTESQGIALNEAWIRDIPTLVWNKGYWEYAGIRWDNEKISAPYLSEETGLFFKGEKDFEEKLQEFISKLKSFKPRIYSLPRFTDEVCTRQLMNIIDSIK